VTKKPQRIIPTTAKCWGSCLAPLAYNYNLLTPKDPYQRDRAYATLGPAGYCTFQAYLGCYLLSC